MKLLGGTVIALRVLGVPLRDTAAEDAVEILARNEMKCHAIGEHINSTGSRWCGIDGGIESVTRERC